MTGFKYFMRFMVYANALLCGYAAYYGYWEMFTIAALFVVTKTYIDIKNL